MDILQDLLHEAIMQAYRNFLEEIIVKKLNKMKILDRKVISKHIVEHILSGNKEPFIWKSKDVKNIKLIFTESDIKKVDRLINNYIPILTTMVSKMFLKSLRNKWPAEKRHQIKNISGFRKRLEERWGEPLGQLRLLLTISREWGQAVYNRNLQPGVEGKELKDILFRLHIRACQVTDEIICLLENGFADGAMARWRTLHEIGVIAAIISKYGDDMAKRYIAHQAVASKRALDKYMSCYQEIGYKSVSKLRIQKIETAYRASIEKFGENFRSEYGWASKHLNNNKPTFSDLEKETGYGEMRSHYSMSSDNIHAGNVKSIFFRLGLPENYNGFLAGRSNAGLMEPGQNAAHSLTRISITACLQENFLEDVVIAQMMKDVRGKIPLFFYDANKKLEQDHAKSKKTDTRNPIK